MIEHQKTDPKEKTIIGMVEHITIYSGLTRKTVLARIDTGAVKSSIDRKLAGELGLGPAIRHAYVKSASGRSIRPVIKTTVNLAGKLITAQFTIAVREHLRYDVLIGQNVLTKGNFLIDPLKSMPTGEDEDE